MNLGRAKGLVEVGKRPLFFKSGFLLAVLGLLGWRLLALLLINAWSVDYSRLAMNDQPRSELLASEPPDHRRGATWASQALLEEGQLHAAQAALAQDGDPDILALRQNATVDWAKGQSRRAVHELVRLGDYQDLAFLAALAEKQGDMPAAAAAFAGASTVDPEAGVLRQADFLERNFPTTPRAQNVLKVALQGHPASVSRILWLRRLGSLLSKHALWNESIQAFDQVLSEDPTDAPALIGLAWAYYGQCQCFEKPYELILQAINQAPEQGQAYFEMGLLYDRQRRYAEAVHWYSLAIDRDPSNGWWQLVLGNAARSAGDLDRALRVYEAAISIDPGWPNPYYESAWAYHLKGDFVEAIGSIQKAIQLQASPDAAFFLRAATIYEAAGDSDAAFGAYRQILRIDPGNLVAMNAIQTHAGQNK